MFLVTVTLRIDQFGQFEMWETAQPIGSWTTKEKEVRWGMPTTFLLSTEEQAALFKTFFG
jgi:hypothetical protein